MRPLTQQTVRTLNIIGLVLTTIGAALLVRFPPFFTMMTADGGGVTSFHWDALSSVATLAFLGGFVIQLIAIIRAS